MAEEKNTEKQNKKMTANSPDDNASIGNHPGNQQFADLDFVKGIGSQDFQGVMGNAAELKARQHLLNPKKYRTEFKKPNPGKMPNNQDAFPVDQKIEEFESHYPPTRIYELDTHVHGKEAAMAAMQVGFNAEKRLIKLENNVATLTRLLFRMGSRMRINCMYYGGQSPFEKYKCIRCLCDDRVSDGQNVQIDQCLYCTRYEPVDGQVYEIMNDLGANVAAVLDDNQASYSTIEEYVHLGRTEEFREALEKASIDLAQIQIRNKDEVDFSTAWGPGLKMNWSYVPKEDQKTHINWRQSINDDGSSLGRLASYPGNEANAGANIVKGAGSGVSSLMKQNKAAMDSYQPVGKYGSAVVPLISTGKSFEGQRDDTINWFKGAEYNNCKKACAGNADPLIVGCIAYVTKNSDYAGIAGKYNEMAMKIDTNNPAVIVSAIGTSEKVFLGILKDKGDPTKRDSYGNLPRIDLPLIPPKPVNPGDATNNTNTEDTMGDGVNISWQNRNSWMWTEFAPRLIERAPKAGGSADTDLFPKVCYLYCTMVSVLTNSRFDEGDIGFPFFDDQFEKYGMNYSSAYGYREQYGRMHYGIDIGSEGGAEIHAAHDGTVVEDGTGSGWGPWHGICIDHGDGTYSRYLHCASMCVTAGQKVSRGDVIGTVGGWGESGPDSYDTHLHFEYSPGDALGTKSPQDPLSYYPKFQAEVSKGDALRPA